MSDGDKFVITVTQAPYRCPPAPYERACIVADYLKNQKGFTNCEIIVLDQNSEITVEQETFTDAFNDYGIEYISEVTISSVNSDTKTVTYLDSSNNSTTLESDVLNVIPNQKAGSLIFDAELNSGNWGAVDPISYESTITDNIYIIGDGQNTSQPKAGHIANSEAKICADAILRTINNIDLYSNPKTNSACYTPISRTEASWLTAVYEPDSTNKAMVLVSGANYPASGSPSTSNYSMMLKWAENLFADSFV